MVGWQEGHSSHDIHPTNSRGFLPEQVQEDLRRKRLAQLHLEKRLLNRSSSYPESFQVRPGLFQKQTIQI